MIKDISYTDLYKKESTVMAEKRIKMTKERYDSQIEKLTYLKNEKRDEIASLCFLIVNSPPLSGGGGEGL